MRQLNLETVTLKELREEMETLAHTAMYSNTGNAELSAINLLTIVDKLTNLIISNKDVFDENSEWQYKPKLNEDSLTGVSGLTEDSLAIDWFNALIKVVKINPHCSSVHKHTFTYLSRELYNKLSCRKYLESYTEFAVKIAFYLLNSLNIDITIIDGETLLEANWFNGWFNNHDPVTLDSESVIVDNLLRTVLVYEDEDGNYYFSPKHEGILTMFTNMGFLRAKALFALTYINNVDGCTVNTKLIK